MIINLVLFSLFIKLNFINGIPPPFYNLTDHIETFYDDDFEEKVFNSNRITYMEFYATWCGYSIYFKPHWRDFANETLGWHKHVLRVGAIDCFHIQYHQGRICAQLNISIYPAFKLYHAKTHNLYTIDRENDTTRSEKFMRVTIDFIEHQRHPPREWPNLSPYKFDLSLIFDMDKGQKYAILIFEPSDSYLGRKLILDFSEYVEHILIHRAIYENNPDLFKNFQIDSSFEEPQLYVITNSHNSIKTFEKLDEFVAKMSRSEVHNKVDTLVLNNKYGIQQKTRYKYMKMIFDLIKYNDLEFDLNEADL